MDDMISWLGIPYIFLERTRNAGPSSAWVSLGPGPSDDGRVGNRRPDRSVPGAHRGGRGRSPVDRNADDREELTGLDVVFEHVAGLDLVDPAVESDLPGGEGRGDGGVRPQVLELDEHVLLGQHLPPGIFGQIPVLRQDDLPAGVGVAE